MLVHFETLWYSLGTDTWAPAHSNTADLGAGHAPTRLGAYSMGLYGLGAHSLAPPTLKQATHSLNQETYSLGADSQGASLQFRTNDF